MITIFLLLSLLEFIVLIGFIFLSLTQIIAVFTTDAPFVSVPDEIDDEIIDNLELAQDSILYDLGCGDAKVLIKAIKKIQGIQAVGVEKSLIPYFLAKFNSRKHNNIQIRREDIFSTDISSATHIFVYLSTKAVNKLFGNIKNQCKKGVRLISCDFELNSISPDKIVELDNSNKRIGKKLFIYTI